MSSTVIEHRGNIRIVDTDNISITSLGNQNQRKVTEQKIQKAAVPVSTINYLNSLYSYIVEPGEEVSFTKQIFETSVTSFAKPIEQAERLPDVKTEKLKTKKIISLSEGFALLEESYKNFNQKWEKYREKEAYLDIEDIE